MVKLVFVLKVDTRCNTNFTAKAQSINNSKEYSDRPQWSMPHAPLKSSSLFAPLRLCG